MALSGKFAFSSNNEKNKGMGTMENKTISATSALATSELQDIYFAGGCFWGVEEYFSRITGVHEVTVGYANGSKANPSYEEV